MCSEIFLLFCQDLGNYERFTDVTLQRDNNITTGRRSECSDEPWEDCWDEKKEVFSDYAVL